MLEKIGRYNWVIIILLYIIAEVLINPIGEFPLNDDWAYSKPIFTFLNSGEIKFLDWQAIPGITMQITGLFICKIFGFSFTSLRLLSIIATIIVIITLNQILKTYELKPRLRFFVLLVLVFNPLAFSLSNTFMPDTFMLMLTLIAFLFMDNLVRKFNWGLFIWFIVFTLLASLVRQTGVILPLVFTVIWLVINPLKVKTLFIGLIPLLVNIIILFIYGWIFKKTGKLPGNFNYQFGNIIHAVLHPSTSLLRSFLYYFTTSTICLGLFLLPLTICNLKSHLIQLKNHLGLRIIAILYIGIAIMKIILSKNALPFVGNIMYPSGLGPIILTGFNSQEIIVTSHAWQIFWQILNLLGALSFCCAMISVFNKLLTEKLSRNNYLSLLIPLLFILYIFPICLSYANDRYLLFLLPFLLLAYILSSRFQIRKILFSITIIPLIFFSVAGTHDYLNINRARWQAANYLTNELQVSPADIDGGFEFNAWYLFGSKKYNSSHKGRWWWVDNDMYIISPVIIQGYLIKSEYKCSTWLAYDLEQIYILKKK